ncbi:hypothetical protein [Campylobacter avium]|uniref:hypothetical protein n=1 Tax=Campylobacter avium TaxID=522485 RepID=UPI00255BB98A|nr:hypothetical protein [Campylobacter avium]
MAKKSNAIEMSKEEFKKMIHECGFQTYKELAEALNITVDAVNIWNIKGKYPKYIITALKWYQDSKKYDELIACNTLDKNLIELDKENKELEEKLQKLKKMKMVILNMISISNSN